MSDKQSALISFPAAQFEEALEEYYLESARIDAASRLGSVLERLTAALDAAEATTQVPASFKTDLIAMVPSLRRYALSLTFDVAEADDLVQHMLLKAWEHRRRFQPGTNLVGSLFTILRKHFSNGRRKHRLEVPDVDGLQANSLSSPAQQEHRAEMRNVQAALDRLDPTHREALLLVAVEGLSYEAAAEVIGCPRGTVKRRVSRARDRLAAELGES